MATADSLDRNRSKRRAGQLKSDIVAGLWRLDEGNYGRGPGVVVMEGADENFCAGADVNEFSDASPGRSHHRNLIAFIRDVPVPVVERFDRRRPGMESFGDGGDVRNEFVSGSPRES